MLLIKHPDSYPAERAYVHEVVLSEFLGLRWRSEARPEGPVELVAPADGQRRLRIADVLFSTRPEQWLTAASLPARPLARWDVGASPLAPTLVSTQLPIVYGEEPLYAEDPGRSISLGVDLLGSIFFQLSRYEEVAHNERDQHERFPAAAMLARQEGFLDRPLVNEYVEVLRSALTRLWPGFSTRRRSFALRLSHDVDWPTHARLSVPGAGKAMLGDLVRRRDPGLVPTRVATLRAQRRRRPSEDPYNTFDFIMDQSEVHGLRSAFYFMSGRSDPRYDSTYSLQSDWVSALLARVHERGHEIGLHPSYSTFRDPDRVHAEFGALLRACERLHISQTAWGGRQHFLRWENPTTWRAWARAGLDYDSSLGFSDAAGFRCGVCFEYPVFDLHERRELPLRERPLIVMEMAVIDGGPSRDSEALSAIALLRERCQRFGGEFTLLWHNSRLASPRERRLYAAAVAGNSEF
ncbi:MAG: polysaccharide deacetylase family protein [Solirubrobacterales bacterium]|nr:polysaccharide deacetylase family protein [Solirubrobacterales bacterium]